MRLSLVGVSHRRAPVELRERVALDLERSSALARKLADGGEAIVLSTCNRTELYVARETGDGELAALRVLLEQGHELAAVAYRLHDDAAALHLFRVAAGLDSLVPGEGEILGQVRDAAEAGAPGPFLERLFRQAISAGRKVRVETAIGESPSSVPAAAAALAQQVFDDLTGRKVLLVGAGKMSELTARNLLTRGAEVVAVANRSEEHGRELAAKLGATAVGLDDLRRGRPLLLVDLAVPRDIDPLLGALDGCFVYDIDDLEAVVEQSLAGRRNEAVRAERLVAEEAERFREWRASLDVVPVIASLRSRAEEIRAAELARLGRLGDEDRKLVETVTSQLVNKLLHLPTVRLKEAAAAADGVLYADAVRHLFGLEEEERRT
jgi:glutamyl-tRNA reductase